jgi:hypothetical protein
MISQLGLNMIYSASVGTMPTLTFYICAALAGLALFLSFFVHPTPITATNTNNNNTYESSQ